MLSKYSRLIATLLFLVILFSIFELTGLREKISIDFIQDNFNHHFIIGMIIFAGLYSLGNLVQIPGFIFLGAAVVTLGQIEGAAVSYLAALISCTCTYWVIRCLGGDALRQLESPVARKILSKLDEDPVKTIIVLRTLFQTAPALNYSLALAGTPFKKYFLGTLLGLPLPVVLYCTFFDLINHSLH